MLNLRRAFEYSELQNDALNVVLKIGKEQYGIQFSKKLVPGGKRLSHNAYVIINRMPV